MATQESGDGRRHRRSSLFRSGTHAALSGWTEIIASYDQYSWAIHKAKGEKNEQIQCLYRGDLYCHSFLHE